MDMNLSKLLEIVTDWEAWHDAVHGVTKSQIQLSDWTKTTKPTRINEERTHWYVQHHPCTQLCLGSRYQCSQQPCSGTINSSVSGKRKLEQERLINLSRKESEGQCFDSNLCTKTTAWLCLNRDVISPKVGWFSGALHQNLFILFYFLHQQSFWAHTAVCQALC